MVRIYTEPTEIRAAGNKSKIIQEFIGKVNSSSTEVSIARMKSPAGWIEPGQTPAFNEYTLVLAGSLHIKTKTQEYTLTAGQAIMTEKGQWIQYSTPEPGGAEYIAVCVPAFSMDTVHRDPSV